MRLIYLSLSVFRGSRLNEWKTSLEKLQKREGGRGAEVVCGEQGKRQTRGQNAHNLRRASPDKDL